MLSLKAVIAISQLTCGEAVNYVSEPSIRINISSIYNVDGNANTHL